MTTIAFIGLGHMGGGMAANLAKAGHDVRAFDLSPDALDRAKAAGCLPATSAAEAVADATSGSTIITFIGYVVGPSLFAALVPHVGWRVAFMLVAAQLAAMAVVQTVLLLRRR